MIKYDDLRKLGIEKELFGGKNAHGYGTTHNGLKYCVNWIRTKDGKTWISSPRGGYRLAGNRKAPAGF